MNQKEYIEILFNDLEFSYSQSRAYLLEEFGSKDLDALTTKEKSKLINTLKEMKG